MGEKLQWAVKNGDMPSVKELVEKVWKVHDVVYGRFTYVQRAQRTDFREYEGRSKGTRERALRLLCVGIRGGT